MSELTPADANRLFYEEHAARYDETEFCQAKDEPRRRLRALLARAVELCRDPARVLDAGGGTGNASLMLVDMGLDPLVVDVSAEMTDRWRRKATARGHTPRTEVAPLEDFLASDERSWDLIVFSSVLHHLQHPGAILRLAGERLAPGGVIVTSFDPTQATRTSALLRRVDYVLWTLLHSPRRALALIRRRIAGSDHACAHHNIGALAELHAVSGLDDEWIASEMTAGGFEVVEHERRYDSRYLPVRAALRLLRTPTSFSFLLQKAPRKPANA